MNSAAILLVALNFGLIGLLPRCFFRRDGHYNLPWLSTAAPFFVAGTCLLLALCGIVRPLILPGTDFMILAAVALSALSIGLIGLTLGCHRVPLALWHQKDDAPRELVTWGAYARIRHPFYSAFLLAFAAQLLALPHALTLAAAVYAILALTLTAHREERRLSASRFGREYRNYMCQTGRFWPRWRRYASD